MRERGAHHRLSAKYPFKFVKNDLELDPHLEVWLGRDGNIVHHEGGVLVVKDLKRY